MARQAAGQLGDVLHQEPSHVTAPFRHDARFAIDFVDSTRNRNRSHEWPSIVPRSTSPRNPSPPCTPWQPSPDRKGLRSYKATEKATEKDAEKDFEKVAENTTLQANSEDEASEYKHATDVGSHGQPSIGSIASAQPLARSCDGSFHASRFAAMITFKSVLTANPKNPPSTPDAAVPKARFAQVAFSASVKLNSQ